MLFLQGGAQVGSNSKNVRKAVHKCALRGLLAAAQDQQMRAAIQKAQGAGTVQVSNKPLVLVCCSHLLVQGI